jgi:hypothetical protein
VAINPGVNPGRPSRAHLAVGVDFAGLPKPFKARSCACAPPDVCKGVGSRTEMFLVARVGFPSCEPAPLGGGPCFARGRHRPSQRMGREAPAWSGNDPASVICCVWSCWCEIRMIATYGTENNRQPTDAPMVFLLALELFYPIVPAVDFMPVETRNIRNPGQELPCGQALCDGASVRGGQTGGQQEYRFSSIVINACKRVA